MEFVFLGILLFLMVWALTSGYPVAFALPGSAIIAIGLAAASGYLIEGDSSAYFAEDGPSQWLSAGVTNFRSLYWTVDRDTLIAIPLFIFMGIMLQRSKVAEDLLVAMAQLFGPLPGGLGISVIFVGALLAATTGIVGATVIAMGLISLPAMMRSHYSKSLATGTICASGTLGQIIPPSIVLIILADQLSSAAAQANTARKELYRTMTGEFTMPSPFEVVSASAGDMFMGALIPGLILVGIYMAYILIVAWIKPEAAPPVPYEGKYDRYFARNILLAIIPPLALIFVVLGSIILGIATVNQAGAIGAVGAMLMAGYRLHQGNVWSKYLPIVIAIAAIVLISIMKYQYVLNIKNIQSEEEYQAILLAAGAAVVLLFAVAWSAWRTYRISNTLMEVMIETAKTTSMVFIILIGAAMLTAAFRAFGGEALVQHYLTGLPGGFWTQFIVVMVVIFLLGFFLDFIEIAVVVVPIVAPILLMNPEANITAVWLGVMIGLNIQTSFLTPPFGFALFYLRGVADKAIKTMDIYKGATAFIALQLLALCIAGYYPSLINYLPNRSYLLSESAPPPINPKLQTCLSEYTDEQFATYGDNITQAIKTAQNMDTSMLPEALQQRFTKSTQAAQQGLALREAIQQAEQKRQQFLIEYRPLHQTVRAIQANDKKLIQSIENLKNEISQLRFKENSTPADEERLQARIQAQEAEKAKQLAEIPAEWEAQHQTYQNLDNELNKIQREYFMITDTAYQELASLISLIQNTNALSAFEPTLNDLEKTVQQTPVTEALESIKQAEDTLGDMDASEVKSPLSKARRLLKKEDTPETRQEAMDLLVNAKQAYQQELSWRQTAQQQLLPALLAYNDSIKNTLGVRSQTRLTDSQAKYVARCLSSHKDISLHF